MSTEIPESSDPEAVTLANPVRAVRTVVDGTPTVTQYVVMRTFPNRAEVHFPELERMVVVPRNPLRQPVRQAVRDYLQGGAR